MEYCVSAFVKFKKEFAYRMYMSDALMEMVNAYGYAHGVKENLIIKRFVDIINPPAPKKEETAADIINRMRAKARGK